ncbi:MAG: hypothetical protein KDE27_13535 [Planctomycetes bacterium]|nr:hypothetical protein [Planctomycetota bacterium]
MNARPTRSWPRALGLAALTPWPPALLPYWFGPLRECGGCVATYTMCLPLMPAIAAPIVLGLDDVLFFVVGGGATALLFAGLAWQ